MRTRRGWLVYGVLAGIWLLLLGWQIAEHIQMSQMAQAGFRRRAEDISNTLALIMRSQRFFVSRERIESVLNDLVKQGEVSSIKLFNVAGEEVASAGAPIEIPKGDISSGEIWDDEKKTMTVMNLVDLGTNIIMKASEFPTNRPPRTVGGANPAELGNTNTTPSSETNISVPVEAPATVTRQASSGTNGAAGFRRGFGSRQHFSEAEIKTMIQNKSAHGFMLVMPAKIPHFILKHDLLLRVFIVFLAMVAVVGLGLAWRSVLQNSDLQIRLVRASELNSHLKEMNLAAAGLAHETRNPLNIVSGLAQMIFKMENAPAEIRLKSREIIEETERVAAQLNEFINYSRPREVRRARVGLQSLVADVTRTLNYDIEEKQIQFANQCDDLVAEADEQLLRQALFNLVLNSIQAVAKGGAISLRAARHVGNECTLEISDNGPGVPPEHRADIFKPYFTTHQEGTGLGLAVVQQIVLAHGWEIECRENVPSGACFRISHIKLLT